MALTVKIKSSERPNMKAWPSILSTDGVSILIVVQKTDVHSNQWCSIYCYHLASNDTCPSVTKRVEGNVRHIRRVKRVWISETVSHFCLRERVLLWYHCDFWFWMKIKVQRTDLKNHYLSKMTHRLPCELVVYWDYISISGYISGYHLSCCWTALQRFHW